MDTYRVIVVALAAKDESEEGSYVARVPELPGCEASGSSRAEAIEAVERELSAQLDNMREADVEPPTPIDALELNGELSVKVTQELHRELLFQAKMQEMDLEAYLAELLARTAGARRERGAGRGRDQDDRGNRRGNRRGGGPAGQRYHNIMENRADFIEYVRQLDQDGGGGGRGRGRGGR